MTIEKYKIIIQRVRFNNYTEIVHKQEQEIVKSSYCTEALQDIRANYGVDVLKDIIKKQIFEDFIKILPDLTDKLCSE